MIPKPTGADKRDEARVRDAYQRRGRKSGSPQRRSSYLYDERDERDERRGRQRSRSPSYSDGGKETRRYRERKSQRSKSAKPAKDRCESLLHDSDYSHPARRSPSLRRSIEGRYHSPSRSRSRSRSPRRDEHNGRGGRHYQHRRAEDDEQGYTKKSSSYARRRGQRSLTPVAVREERIKETSIPETAYPLRDYTNYISDNHGKQRRITRANHHLPAFRNGDGKVNPSAYGSILQYDLGLCYCTFKTMFECEMGVRCPWRHHPLSKREKQWIEEIARDKGRGFIKDTDEFWANPEVPVPGINLIEMMQRERR